LYFDKLNTTHPEGAYLLKAVFYWIELKNRQLFFVVILFFVHTHVQQKLYACR
ncbi:MAG: hypothetical protein FD170_3785, partial [Bacteroidetes bacterium]